MCDTVPSGVTCVCVCHCQIVAGVEAAAEQGREASRGEDATTDVYVVPDERDVYPLTYYPPATWVRRVAGHARPTRPCRSALLRCRALTYVLDLSGLSLCLA